MKFLLSLLLLMSLIACSGGKSLEEVADGSGIDVPAQDEFEEDFAEEAGDELAESVDDAFGDDAFGDDAFGEDAFTSDSSLADDSFSEEGSTEMVSEFSDGGTGMEMTASVDSSGTYTVQQGETLMLIAFKIYGDYGRWRELARLNSGKLGSRYTVSQGTVITYNPPVEPFQWSPTGNPYLIKNGDTLGTISSDTYGTTKYWRNIWKNNTPLIKDPNKIFAGFTIYTPVIDSRGVANQGF
ncbi:MAG: hypothetical protein CME65_11935 [Halobacteriovoraceae bacterium]|nr:hypothetical protein [Halobacteriovoraceae bacterium]|tara:strand:- start:3615 stop:4334 length:720 start_codon:yes stop_codon:yes gene_type:complete